ncbi:MAG TPA: PLP-dependent aminotransferase family protein [Chloroflexia bacterium]|nr:PLP-dependent aminotransferase family protein [Chloroflexia bacterium]
MAKKTISPFFNTLPLDPASTTPLYRQLYEVLRQAILSGQLSSGARLPSTRLLADGLNLSRNTVTAAFDQLLAEGYIEGRHGSGTFVSAELPEDLLAVRNPDLTIPNHDSLLRPDARTQQNGNSNRPANRELLSERGRLLVAAPTLPASRLHAWQGKPLPFTSELPALDRFPADIWTRLLNRRLRQSLPELLGYKHASGFYPLREAIATYTGATRGIKCCPEQIIIVSGSQQGLDLVMRLLIDPGDQVVVEEPGYPGVKGAALASGGQIIPVPVDQNGMNVAEVIKRAPHARLAYVTPSHQFPLGVTLNASRRLALLEWARQANAWIIEDDYDSEYRYSGRPLAALQGLDRHDRVIYLGTFSKTVFPALRIGFLVAPPPLVEAFEKARYFEGVHSPILEQAVLTDFIVEGHFARHVRRMRALYAERQACLLEVASKELQGQLDLRPAETGMSLVARLQQGVSGKEVARQAALQNLALFPISNYALEPLERDGLFLGFAAFDEASIREGVKRLAGVLSKKIPT